MKWILYNQCSIKWVSILLLFLFELNSLCVRGDGIATALRRFSLQNIIHHHNQMIVKNGSFFFASYKIVYKFEKQGIWIRFKLRFYLSVIDEKNSEAKEMDTGIGDTMLTTTTQVLKLPITNKWTEIHIICGMGERCMHAYIQCMHVCVHVHISLFFFVVVVVAAIFFIACRFYWAVKINLFVFAFHLHFIHDN